VFEDLDGRRAIVIDELPYQVNKARLVEQIAELVKDKKLEGVFALRDESDRQRHARRHRAQAGRARGGGAQPPVQTHRAPEHVRRDPARDREPAPADPVAQGAAPTLHRAPPRGPKYAGHFSRAYDPGFSRRAGEEAFSRCACSASPAFSKKSCSRNCIELVREIGQASKTFC
jgi:hypothetical protein